MNRVLLSCMICHRTSINMICVIFLIIISTSTITIQILNTVTITITIIIIYIYHIEMIYHKSYMVYDI